MNFQRLQYFVSVANNLSFTKAANECHIAQTAMSRQITTLEEELDIKLFERDNRHVSLTDEGKEFYWFAVHLLEIYNEAMERMKVVSKRKKYNLKIGLGPYENYLFSHYLKDFKDTFPDIELTCLQFNYEQLSSKLTNGTIDVMFCIHHCAERVLNVEKFLIYDGPWGVISNPAHPFAQRRMLMYRDLTDETIITMSEYNFDAWKNQLVKNEAYIKDAVRVNTYVAKQLFVQAGYGVAMVPEFVVEGLPRDLRYSRMKNHTASPFVCAYLQGKSNSIFTSFISYIKSYGKIELT